MATKTKKSVFYIQIQAFGLDLNITGICTPKAEGVPIRFEVTTIEDRGLNITKYIKSFGLMTEVEDAVKDKLSKNPN